MYSSAAPERANTPASSGSTGVSTGNAAVTTAGAVADCQLRPITKTVTAINADTMPMRTYM